MRWRWIGPGPGSASSPVRTPLGRGIFPHVPHGVIALRIRRARPFATRAGLAPRPSEWDGGSLTTRGFGLVDQWPACPSGFAQGSHSVPGTPDGPLVASLGLPAFFVFLFRQLFREIGRAHV